MGTDLEGDDSAYPGSDTNTITYVHSLDPARSPTPHVYLASDAAFISRIAAQATLPETPPDVKAEAEALSAEVTKLVPTSGVTVTANLDLDELCPACHARVPLADLGSAVCPNGHRWRTFFKCDMGLCRMY